MALGVESKWLIPNSAATQPVPATAAAIAADNSIQRAVREEGAEFPVDFVEKEYGELHSDPALHVGNHDFCLQH